MPVRELKLREDNPLPAGLYINDIYHDDWCRIYQGGYCNCDPIIELPARWLPPKRN